MESDSQSELDRRYRAENSCLAKNLSRAKVPIFMKDSSKFPGLPPKAKDPAARVSRHGSRAGIPKEAGRPSLSGA
jgi:hypothetical protein